MDRKITMEYNSEDGYITINSVFKRHPKVFKSIRGNFTIGQDRGYVMALACNDDTDKTDDAFLDLFDTITCFNSGGFRFREDSDMIRLIELSKVK